MSETKIKRRNRKKKFHKRRNRIPKILKLQNCVKLNIQVICIQDFEKYSFLDQECCGHSFIRNFIDVKNIKGIGWINKYYIGDNEKLNKSILFKTILTDQKTWVDKKLFLVTR